MSGFSGASVLRARGDRYLLALGLLLLLVSLGFYRSYESREWFGVWSTRYTALFGVTTLAWLTLTFLIPSTRLIRVRGTPTPERWLFASGIGVLGVAHLAASVGGDAGYSWLLSMRIFGGVDPWRVVLGWLAMSLLATSVIVWAGHTMVRRVPEVFLLAVTLVASGLVLEAAARAKAVFWPEIQGFPSYSYRMWFERHTTMDSLGFRSAPPDSKADRRLLVVGDSYAFGVGIEERENRFGERLATSLARKTGESWGVFTASRPGASTREEVAYLEYGLTLEPDIIVLLYVFNDIEYLSPVVARNLFTEVPTTLGELLHPMRLAYMNLFLYQEIYVRARLLGASVRSPDTTLYDDPILLDAHLDDLDELAAVAGDVPFAIVPFDVAVVASDVARRRYDRLITAAVDRGLPMIPLTEVFDGYEFDELTANALDRHPNELAHRLAAQASADRIAGLLRRDSPGTADPAE